MMPKISIIQANGQVTLPASFRKRYNLEKGDAILFQETEDGLLISPRAMLALRLLDEIGDDLEKRGVTYDDLVEEGQRIRAEIYQEKYTQSETKAQKR